MGQGGDQGCLPQECSPSHKTPASTGHCPGPEFKRAPHFKLLLKTTSRLPSASLPPGFSTMGAPHARGGWGSTVPRGARRQCYNKTCSVRDCSSRLLSTTLACRRQRSTGTFNTNVIASIHSWEVHKHKSTHQLNCRQAQRKQRPHTGNPLYHSYQIKFTGYLLALLAYCVSTL